MKLRIRGNSLRLRLTMSEVGSFGLNGKITDTISFSATSEQGLHYSLISSSEVEQVSANFQNGRISIFVPKEVADNWTQTEQVGFGAVQDLSRDKSLSLRVEKDFVCLTDREDEDESDNYPHPNAR